MVKTKLQHLQVQADPLSRDTTELIALLLNTIGSHRNAKGYPGVFYLGVLDQVRASVSLGSALDQVRAEQARDAGDETIDEDVSRMFQ